MDNKDKTIALLRHQLQKALSKCCALEQENALLNNELRYYRKGDESFNIPDYGTDEWANWMVELHVKKGIDL